MHAPSFAYVASLASICVSSCLACNRPHVQARWQGVTRCRLACGVRICYCGRASRRRRSYSEEEPAPPGVLPLPLTLAAISVVPSDAEYAAGTASKLCTGVRTHAYNVATVDYDASSSVSPLSWRRRRGLASRGYRASPAASRDQASTRRCRCRSVPACLAAAAARELYERRRQLRVSAFVHNRPSPLLALMWRLLGRSSVCAARCADLSRTLPLSRTVADTWEQTDELRRRRVARRRARHAATTHGQPANWLPVTFAPLTPCARQAPAAFFGTAPAPPLPPPPTSWPVDTHLLVRKLEGAGLGTQQAEQLAAHICQVRIGRTGARWRSHRRHRVASRRCAQVLMDSLERHSDKFASKTDAEKVRYSAARRLPPG